MSNKSWLNSGQLYTYCTHNTVSAAVLTVSVLRKSFPHFHYFAEIWGGYVGRGSLLGIHSGWVQHTVAQFIGDPYRLGPAHFSTVYWSLIKKSPLRLTPTLNRPYWLLVETMGEMYFYLLTDHIQDNVNPCPAPHFLPTSDLLSPTVAPVYEIIHIQQATVEKIAIARCWKQTIARQNVYTRG